MARAAWALSAVAVLAAGALAAQNSILKSDNQALSEALSSTEQDLADLEKVRRQRPARSASSRRGPDLPPPSERDGSDPATLLAEIPPEDLLSTPGVEHQLQAAVQDQVKSEIGNRRAEFMERRKAEMAENIVIYAEDAELSMDTQESLAAIMDDSMEDAANILRARRENHSSTEQAHEDMSNIHTQLYDDLTELLGEDEAAAFLDTIRGPLKGIPEP